MLQQRLIRAVELFKELLFRKGRPYVAMHDLALSGKFVKTFKDVLLAHEELLEEHHFGDFRKFI